MATVIIASIVAILFVAIIASEIHKKKTGKSACGCSCGSCDGCSACHQDKTCAFLFYIS